MSNNPTNGPRFAPIIHKIRDKLRELKKPQYGQYWQNTDNVNNDRYQEWFSRRPLIHQDFMDFLKDKTDIKTVLEIGCGTGIYPIKHRDLFNGIWYTGIDIGLPSIEHCKRNSDFTFICGDFIKMDLPERYDLVFSHAVIDHVYDINKFLAKIVQVCSRHAYISAYRGYFPDLERHKMTWNVADGCYYNDLSLHEAKIALIQQGLTDNEIILRRQASGLQLGQPYSIGLDGYETIIELRRSKKT